jgi:hypothetical protein
MLFPKDANTRISVSSLNHLVEKIRWFSKKLEKIILSGAGKLLKIFSMTRRKTYGTCIA